MTLVTSPVDSPSWLRRRCQQQECCLPECERGLPAHELVARLRRPARLMTGFRELGTAWHRRHDAVVLAIR